MASPGHRLCVLSLLLLLCAAASLGMSAALDSNSSKPIIGKKAGRGPGLRPRWRLALRHSRARASSLRNAQLLG